MAGKVTALIHGWEGDTSYTLCGEVNDLLQGVLEPFDSLLQSVLLPFNGQWLFHRRPTGEPVDSAYETYQTNWIGWKGMHLPG